MAGSGRPPNRKRRMSRTELDDGIDVPADVQDDEAGRTIGARARRLDSGGSEDVDDDDDDERDALVVSRLGVWQRFVHTGAIPVEDGIKARTRRGRIGSTWWSQRFLSVIEELDLGGRLDRARTYARKGQVTDIDVDRGRMTARVQGSRRTPYRVEIRLQTLDDEDWTSAVEALGRRASFTARLLAGEMPDDVEAAFAESHVALFPRSAAELSMQCTCPDWSVPCKHVAAVLYLMAEELDTDPFLLMTWRGRTKDELLAMVREQRGAAVRGGGSQVRGTTTEDGAAGGREAAGFWSRSEIRLVTNLPESPVDIMSFTRSTQPVAAPCVELSGMPEYGRILARAAARAAKAARRAGGVGGTREG